MVDEILQDGQLFVVENVDTEVNWNKFERIYEVVYELQRYQKQVKRTPYPFRFHFKIHNIINMAIENSKSTN